MVIACPCSRQPAEGSGIEGFLTSLRGCRFFLSLKRYWAFQPARPARLVPFPSGLDPRLSKLLASRGIGALYSHQAQAFELASSGNDVVVVTPTASGKTLCFNLPVFNLLLHDQQARAIYLFPTKALAADQLSTLLSLCKGLAEQPPGTTLNLFPAVYDGDTNMRDRERARNQARILLTNPDMLNYRILPESHLWLDFLENLRFLIIDEIRLYRGGFGSHVANVLRRLTALTPGSGVRMRIITCSGTIANPGEHASALCGRKTKIVAESGAPRGPRHLIVADPHRLGTKGDAYPLLNCAVLLGRLLLRSGVQAVIFARRHEEVELLVRLLRLAVGKDHPPEAIQGYRGGYLPGERRRIEEGLRHGTVRLVISTSALEVGVDVGGLRGCVICGYPGSMAGLWQQAGRVGRDGSPSVIILLTGRQAIDRHLAAFPELIFSAGPEFAHINPDNPIIQQQHLEAAAEHKGAPIRGAEKPSSHLLTTNGQEIGALGSSRAGLKHPGAIYLHNGESYRVTSYKRRASGYRFELEATTQNHLTAPKLASALLSAVPVESCCFSNPPGLGSVYIHHGKATLVKSGTVLTRFDPRKGRTSAWERASLGEAIPVRTWWMTLPSTLNEVSAPEQLAKILSFLGQLIILALPRLILCDHSDVKSMSHPCHPWTGLPTLYLYDTFPGGSGIIESAYRQTPELLHRTLLWDKGMAGDLNRSPSIPSPGTGIEQQTTKLIESILYYRLDSNHISFPGDTCHQGGVMAFARPQLDG